MKRLFTWLTECSSNENTGLKRGWHSEGRRFVQHNASSNSGKYWENFSSIAQLSFNPSLPWAPERWKKFDAGCEQCRKMIKDEEFTVRIRQRDVVLSSHEDLSYVTQCNLRSWILINNQIHWLDAGPVQILQFRQHDLIKHAGILPTGEIQLHNRTQNHRELIEKMEEGSKKNKLYFQIVAVWHHQQHMENPSNFQLDKKSKYTCDTCTYRTIRYN